MHPAKIVKIIREDLQNCSQVSELKIYPPREFQGLMKSSWVACISVKFEGQVCVGMGCSTNPDEASFVSVMELVERLTFVSHLKDKTEDWKFESAGNPSTVSSNELAQLYPSAHHWLGGSSNGLAIYTNASEATERAQSELIERHVILKALALNVSPRVVNMPTAKRNADEILDVTPYTWRGPNDHYVAILRGIKGQHRFYSYGAGKSEKLALEKAAREMDLKLSIVRADFPDHLKFIFGSAHSQFHWSGSTPETDHFFEKAQSTSTPGIDTALGVNDLWVTRLALPDWFSTKLPLYAAKAVSPNMQQLFWGPWTDEIINPLALGKPTLPNELHCVG